jgi:glutamate synthase domain-containing protein 2
MQIGTAKYGIRDQEGNFSPERAKELAKVVKAFEIKLSQGARSRVRGVASRNQGNQ